MKTDIRNREIKVKVKATECASDAIDRYMKRKGFQMCYWYDGRDLPHTTYSNGEYGELWLGPVMVNETTGICTFELDGNL